MLHEQIAFTVASCSTSFSAQNFPTSVLLQEQRDEYRPLLHISKEDRTCQAILNTKQMDMVSVHEENNTGNTDQVAQDFRQHLQLWPRLENLLTSSETGESDASTTTLPRLTVDSKRPAVSLGRKALSPSKKAASVAEDSGSIKADEDADKSVPFGLASAHLANPSLQSNKTVRSTRRLERRLKQRKVPKSKVKDNGKDDAQEGLHVEKKKKEGSDLNLLLQSPDTKQLLTSEQESQLIAQIQELMRLEELKISLQSQFGREATIAEWADSAGLNCRALKAQLRRGNRSKEKLVQANLRMVHHIAKTYQGCGISHEDLLQERVYNQLRKILEAKKLYIQEGNLHPSKEEIARRVGLPIEKIDSVLCAARTPISMHQPVWADQDTTFQEITADTAVESLDERILYMFW